MRRKVKKESVIDQLRAESQKPLSLEQILNARTASMKGVMEEHRK
jgi:hypothetical protein